MGKAERDYIKHLRANIQGGANVDLGPKTLIIGDNGAGKDTIIRGIELALLGRASDIAGKADVGEVQGLAQLAPGRAGSFGAEIETASGAKASWLAVIKSDGTVAKPSWVQVDGAMFPLRDLRDRLAKGSADSKRQFFLEHLGKTVNWSDVVKVTPTSLVETLNKVAADVRELESLSDTGSVLQAARKRANSLKLDFNKQGNAAANLVSSLSETCDVPPSAEEVRAAKERADALQERAKSGRRTLMEALAEHRALSAAGPQAKQWLLDKQAKLKEEVQRADANVQGHMSAIAQYQAEIQQADAALIQLPVGLSDADMASLEQTRDLYQALIRVVQQQAAQAVAGSLSCCVACGQGVNAEAAKAFADSAVSNAQAYLTQLDGYGQVNAARKGWEDRKAFSLHEVARLEPYLASHQAYCQGLLTELEQITRQIASVPGGTAQTADSYVSERGIFGEGPVRRMEMDAEEAARQFNQLAQSLASYEGVAKARDQEAEARGKSARYAALVDACDNAIAALLKKQREAFVTKVRGYMPKADKMPQGGEFDLQLSRDGKDICELGLVRDGILHTALSGAEQDIVLTAVACALAESYPLAVIIAADREKTSRTLTEQMRALAKTQAQVILTSTQKPSGLKGLQGKGWTIIELGGRRAGDTADLVDGGAVGTDTDGIDVLAEEKVEDGTDANAVGTASTLEVANPNPMQPTQTFQWGQYLWNGSEVEFASAYQSIFGMTPKEVYAGATDKGQIRVYDNGAAMYIQGSTWTLYSGTSGAKPTGLARLVVAGVTGDLSVVGDDTDDSGIVLL